MKVRVNKRMINDKANRVRYKFPTFCDNSHASRNFSKNVFNMEITVKVRINNYAKKFSIITLFSSINIS